MKIDQVNLIFSQKSQKTSQKVFLLLSFTCLMIRKSKFIRRISTEFIKSFEQLFVPTRDNDQKPY